MIALAPESLLQTWLGEWREAVAAAIFSEPFHIPYERLASVDGWAVWLGHPPVPDDLVILPAPEALLWDDPATAVATAMLVAADYAIRRGSTDRTSALALLQRESPVAIVVPDAVHSRLSTMLQCAAEAGIPVTNGRTESADELAAVVPAFRARRDAHTVDLGRAHDPALSFQVRVPDVTIGGARRSSFVVHDDPERDAVEITGSIGERFAIEIGISGPDISPESTVDIEREAAVIPSFLDGITAAPEGQSLRIGWREQDSPTAEAIGEAFRVWLKALHGATTVDVRIAFAPASGRSALLANMGARAADIRERRAAAIAGAPEPHASSDDSGRGHLD